MADAERGEVGHQRLGIGEGEALWNCSRSVARGVMAASRVSMVEAPLGRGLRRAARRPDGSKRRRQFGCSSIVPGRFGCSATPSDVLERHERQRRRRLRDEAERGIDGADRCRRPAAASPSATPASVKACHSAARSCRRAALVSRRRRRVPSAAAQLDVGAAPPAGHGRQVVRRGHRDRIGAPCVGARKRLASRSNHSTSMPAMPASRQRGAKAGRHGAEVLADHDGAVAMRFQRQQPQQIVERIGEIGALGRRRAVRHEPEAHQPHGVVDAHAAGVAHAARRVARNGAKPPATSACGEKRGEAPVLAVRIERRRAARRR